MNETKHQITPDEENISDLKNKIIQLRRSFSRMKSDYERQMFRRSFSYKLLEKEKENLDLVQLGISDLRWQMHQAGKDHPLSKLERRALSLNRRLENIQEVRFKIRRREEEEFVILLFTFENEKVFEEIIRPSGSQKILLPIEKTQFVQSLRHLDLADWRVRFGRNQFEDAGKNGYLWSLVISFPRTRPYVVQGYNSYPWNFEEFLHLIKEYTPVEKTDYDQMAEEWRKNHPLS